MDYAAIFDKAETTTVACPREYSAAKRAAGCKVNIWDLQKWAALPHERDGDLNVPQVVSDTHTHANGKHICRVDVVGLMGIHTEVSFEESLDWNHDRIIAPFTSNPAQWVEKSRRFPGLFRPPRYPDSRYPSDIVGYELLHFNWAEWRRWVEGEKLRTGPPHNERQMKKVPYHVLDNVWTRIELNLAKRFAAPDGLFADRVVQTRAKPWADLDDPANG